MHETAAFREIYDYRGGLFRRHRLDRKKEEVSNNFNSRTHLFQKVYYATGLTYKDEQNLREHFCKADTHHEFWCKATGLSMLVAFFPLMRAVSARTRATYMPFVAVGYYGVYRFGLCPLYDQMLQDSLNRHARPLAAKYNITV